MENPEINTEIIVGVNGGKKTDKNKPRWDLVPFDALEGMVNVLTFGANKYEPDNWKKVEMWRYRGALMRHWVAWLSGEDLDPETGLHHLDHMMCNLIFIRWMIKHKGDKK